MAMRIVTQRASGNTVPAEVDALLTAIIERQVERGRAQHVVLGLTDGSGELRWSAASARVAVDPATPFFIASVTKRFIVTLVLQAHERGELDLDERIGRYLPAADLAGLHVWRGVDRTREITVRHLASHTSGLPDHFERRRGGGSLENALRRGADRRWTFDDVLHTTRQLQRPHFAPQDLGARRQKARYSDTGFQLLIRILETVTGYSFSELVTTRIVDRLGLVDTYSPDRSGSASRRSPSTLYSGSNAVDLPAMIESSNDLVSTTKDLLIFQRALCSGALFRDRGMAALLTERSNRLRNIPVIAYGLGTMTFRVGRLMGGGSRPRTLVGHSGATGSWLFSCPEIDLHLAGTIDRTGSRAAPFVLMSQCLAAWSAGSEPMSTRGATGPGSSPGRRPTRWGGAR